jgi:hypothetical protein
MCPIRIHWHVKLNYKEYWRVKITVTNFNYRTNYSQWNLVTQHPNFNNLTTVFSFNYKSLSPYGPISKHVHSNSFPGCVHRYSVQSYYSATDILSFADDTAMFWGIKYYNDLLMTAGPDGNVQSELLFQKEPSTFTFQKGWAFPRRFYFNGDNCVMPPPDSYPWLPNPSPRLSASFLLPFVAVWTTIAILLIHP